MPATAALDLPTLEAMAAHVAARLEPAARSSMEPPLLSSPGAEACSIVDPATEYLKTVHHIQQTVSTTDDQQRGSCVAEMCWTELVLL